MGANFNVCRSYREKTGRKPFCPNSNRQKQPPELFCKKTLLKNFANLIVKHLCWILFLVNFIITINLVKFTNFLYLVNYMKNRL